MSGDDHKTPPRIHHTLTQRSRKGCTHLAHYLTNTQDPLIPIPAKCVSWDKRPVIVSLLRSWLPLGHRGPQPYCACLRQGQYPKTAKAYPIPEAEVCGKPPERLRKSYGNLSAPGRWGRAARPGNARMVAGSGVWRARARSMAAAVRAPRSAGLLAAGTRGGLTCGRSDQPAPMLQQVTQHGEGSVCYTARKKVEILDQRAHSNRNLRFRPARKQSVGP